MAAPLAALMALPLAEKIGLGLGAGFLGSTVLGGLGERGRNKREYLLGLKQLDLQTALRKAELEVAKTENEENRRATEKYLAMFRETQERERQDQTRDRQTQLVMALLQGLTGFQQSAGQTLVQGRRELPPMALTTLMRGM